jgi:glycyl-tRNA synthetase
MVQLNDNIVGLDAAILMHPTTWKASGHVDAFNDPLIDNKDSKKRYRADVLVEDYVGKLDTKIEKEVKKAAKRFGDAFDKAQFLSTNPRVVGYKEKGDAILKRLGKSLEKEDLADVKSLIEELEIVCPVSGSKNWTEVKQFNLMFGTKLGASAESATELYLRPDRTRNFCKLFKRTKNRPHEIALWDCPNGEGFSQRNCCAAVYFPHA